MIRVADDGGVRTVTLGDGSRHNPLAWDDWGAMRAAAESRPAPRALVLRGGGEPEFSSGSDLHEFARLSEAELRACFASTEEAMAALEAAPFPALARVAGYAIGSALELVCACDLAIAARSTRVALPVGRLGIDLGTAAAGRIAAVIGPQRLRALVACGWQLGAEEAHAWGCFTRVVADEELDAACAAAVASCAAASPAALAGTKAAVRGAGERAATTTIDFSEGIAAFLEHRGPAFRP